MEHHFCQGKKLSDELGGRGGFKCPLQSHVIGAPRPSKIDRFPHCRAHLARVTVRLNAWIKCLTRLWNYDILRAICGLGWTEYF
jgi:hypothetical protein